MQLGILTNGFSETHREKIELLQIGEFFDAIFIADEVGMIKPDPLLFAHACTTLGSAPARSAMVGDRYERDVRGALEAGLYAVWLNIRDERVPGRRAAARRHLRDDRRSARRPGARMTQSARDLENTFARAWMLLLRNPVILVPGIVAGALQTAASIAGKHSPTRSCS